MENNGILYVVGGPIGNLGDITYRAVETLKSCALILSEDTRETKKLLDRYQINTPLKSYRDQNHERVAGEILDLVSQGNSAALISDSGTPLISDPGYKLVRDAIGRGIKVVPIPGPSAVVASLSASGLPTDKFIFLGFLPKSDGKRKSILHTYGNLDATLIVYESPYRLVKFLAEVREVLGDRQVCLAGEVTKLYEKFETGNVTQVSNSLSTRPAKGEYTVLISKVIQ